MLILFLFFQIIKFTDAFYAPPVVMVSPRLSYHNNNSRFSASGTCDAVTAWIQVTYETWSHFSQSIASLGCLLIFSLRTYFQYCLYFKFSCRLRSPEKFFFVLFFPNFSNQPVQATVLLSERSDIAVKVRKYLMMLND